MYVSGTSCPGQYDIGYTGKPDFGVPHSTLAGGVHRVAGNVCEHLTQGMECTCSRGPAGAHHAKLAHQHCVWLVQSQSRNLNALSQPVTRAQLSQLVRHSITVLEVALLNASLAKRTASIPVGKVGGQIWPSAAANVL